MLTYLIIRNFAIIDQLEIPIPDAFTVITGETGAGKSIIIDALNLLLGGRANTDVVRYGCERATVEGTFEIPEPQASRVRVVLEERGIDFDGELVVRRLVNRSGRNRVFINGNTVSLSTLQNVTRGLIDISGQHEHYSLLHPEEHINILDNFGNLRPAAQEVASKVDRLWKLRNEVTRLQQSERERLARVDFLRFQLNDIDRAMMEPKEEEDLARESVMLQHGEELRENCSQIQTMLYDSPQSITDALGDAVSMLQDMSDLDDSLSPMVDILENARIQFAEVARDLKGYVRGIDVNPERLEEIEELLYEWKQIKRKFGDSYAEIQGKAEEMLDELKTLERTAHRIEEAETEANALEEETLEAARALSALRDQAAKNLSAIVEQELSDLGMAYCRFAVKHSFKTEEGAVTEDVGETCVESLNARGLDHIEFLLRPNPGAGWGSLAKIASGGELSRVMLAIKTGLMETDPVLSYVFDEVDTGIGGHTADIVGEKIRGVARTKQVLCITHLPQISSYGDHHLKVEKVQTETMTSSRLRKLTTTERIEELARMLGGRDRTEATINHAREMIDRALGREAKIPGRDIETGEIQQEDAGTRLPTDLQSAPIEYEGPRTSF